MSSKNDRTPIGTSLKASVDDWLRRVEAFLKRDSETNEVVAFFVPETKDFLANMAAQLWFEGRFYGGARKRLEFWEYWAADTLRKAGLPAEEDMGVREIAPTGRMGWGGTIGDTPASRLDRVIKRVRTGSAEFFAARLELAVIALKSAEESGDPSAISAHAVAAGELVGMIRRNSDIEALLPDIERGRKDRRQRQRLGQLAAKAREERRGNWRRKATDLDAQLRAEDSQQPVKARAATIAKRLHLSERTVSDFLYQTHGESSRPRARRRE